MGGSLREGQRHKSEWEQRLQMAAMGSRWLTNQLDMTTSKASSSTRMLVTGDPLDHGT